MNCDQCKHNWHSGVCRAGGCNCQKEPFYVSTVEDIPKKPHFALLSTGCHSEDRGGTGNHINYTGFFTEEAFKAAYLKDFQGNSWTKPLGVKITPIIPKVEITIDTE